MDKLVEEFKDGNSIPEAIARSTFPHSNIPSHKWSLLNQLIMYFAETKDARGFKQWKEVNRYVKKGSKSFDILVPRFKKVKDEKSDEERTYLAGFMCAPVFRVEDTDGEPLVYTQLELPQLPLMDVAKKWNISVSAVPGNYFYYGYFKSSEQAIVLATPEEAVFFHELSHAAHEKVRGSLKDIEIPIKEVVAELSALTLSRIVGKDGNKYFGTSYRYIDEYAKQMNITPHTAVLKVLSDVEKVLTLILKSEN